MGRMVWVVVVVVKSSYSRHLEMIKVEKCIRYSMIIGIDPANICFYNLSHRLIQN